MKLKVGGVAASTNRQLLAGASPPLTGAPELDLWCSVLLEASGAFLMQLFDKSYDCCVINCTNRLSNQYVHQFCSGKCADTLHLTLLCNYGASCSKSRNGCSENAENRCLRMRCCAVCLIHAVCGCVRGCSSGQNVNYGYFIQKNVWCKPQGANGHPRGASLSKFQTRDLQSSVATVNGL